MGLNYGLLIFLIKDNWTISVLLVAQSHHFPAFLGILLIVFSKSLAIFVLFDSRIDLILYVVGAIMLANNDGFRISDLLHIDHLFL